MKINWVKGKLTDTLNLVTEENATALMEVKPVTLGIVLLHAVKQKWFIKSFRLK